MSCFHVDGRVNLKCEYDLAMRLGELILSSKTSDKQLVAMGHALLNSDEEGSIGPAQVQKAMNPIPIFPSTIERRSI